MDSTSSFNSSICGAQKAQAEGLLDYYAFLISNKSLDSVYYTKDCPSNASRTQLRLDTFEEWRFLIEDDLILAYSAKEMPNGEYAVECKIKEIPEESNEFQQLIQSWKKDSEREAIVYFAKNRRIEDYENSGIWFVGIENSSSINDETIKIYFKTYFQNEYGDRLYADKDYLDIISNCGIESFHDIVNSINNTSLHSFHVFMVGWNYNRVSNESKYKVYFIAQNEVDMCFFEDIYARFELTPYQISHISTTVKKLNLRFAGFYISRDSSGKETIKLYYEGE